nr:AAA family ATPase [Candidatus Woesebacteria bacterium]
MKISSLIIHNYRSIEDLSVTLDPYSLVLGENNVGKSNIIAAIKAFYDYGDCKFNADRDLPRFTRTDDESWVEIEFSLDTTEYDLLKAEYRLPDNKLRVRKFFHTSQVDAKGKPIKGFVAYEGGRLTNNYFYGAPNVGLGKLGDIIYIPALVSLQDSFKTSGPSPYRDLLMSLIKKMASQSPSFTSLKTAFETFSTSFVQEKLDPATPSLHEISQEISQEMGNWNTIFEIVVNSIDETDLIKNLIGQEITEQHLNEPQTPEMAGHGFQRQLIYTLIRLNAKYTNGTQSSGAEFRGTLTLLLFEEPEVFLHPPYQVSLAKKLKEFASQSNHQVVISTHSENLVSKSITNLPSLIRITKSDGKTRKFQITSAEIQSLLVDNSEISQVLTGYPQNIAAEEYEAAKYLLFLTSERCASFFTKTVLLVEGPSEKNLFDYLIEEGQLNLNQEELTIVDTFGKFNTHRFMALFGKLGIPHAVLIDRDESALQQGVNTFIESKRNTLTKGIGYLETNLENFFGFTAVPPTRGDLNQLWHFTITRLTHKIFQA